MDNKRVIIKKIRDKIAQSISPQKIILFGSHANGTYGKDSDIDLVIIWDNPANQHQRNMMVRRLFPHRTFSLDVFVFTPEEEKKYKNIIGTILHTALSKGVVLYERA